MNYYIKRDASEYGPYSLADLQRYVAQGNIALTDLTRSEGLADWVPVAQVMGNIPVPSPAGYPGAPAYGAAPHMSATPVPPDFHWGLVLLIGFLTCFLFFWAWIIVEAAWIKKIRPNSNALLLVILGSVLYWVTAVSSNFIRSLGPSSLRPFLGFSPWVGIVVLFFGFFQMRSDLENYYNSTENIGLRLSGAMTFFFAVFYFQHHFSRIARWKKGGILEPQY